MKIRPVGAEFHVDRQTDRQTHLLGVFVVLIRSLRLNRCVLLC